MYSVQRRAGRKVRGSDGATCTEADLRLVSGSGSQSPYNHAIDCASFVSTASSHDLTTHAQANTSFDPLMGPAQRGHGMGRFNAGKFNSYLHSLNHRLQEENENLVARLREKYGRDIEGSPAATRAPSSTAAPPWDPPATRQSSDRWRIGAGPALGLGSRAWGHLRGGRR